MHICTTFFASAASSGVLFPQPRSGQGTSLLRRFAKYLGNSALACYKSFALAISPSEIGLSLCSFRSIALYISLYRMFSSKSYLRSFHDDHSRNPHSSPFFVEMPKAYALIKDDASKKTHETSPSQLPGCASRTQRRQHQSKRFEHYCINSFCTLL